MLIAFRCFYFTNEYEAMIATCFGSHHQTAILHARWALIISTGLKFPRCLKRSCAESKHHKIRTRDTRDCVVASTPVRSWQANRRNDMHPPATHRRGSWSRGRCAQSRAACVIVTWSTLLTDCSIIGGRCSVFEVRLWLCFCVVSLLVVSELELKWRSSPQN